MFTEKIKKEFYRALIDKNPEYEGRFYAGIKTTGIFCRPTCPARKPKFENCEFFQTVQEALLSSFRPCMRCHPLSHPNHMSDLVRTLVDAIENNPEKRWSNQDFEALSVDVSTVRRQFKKRFGMTFVEYARARRIGFAMKYVQEGGSVIDAQLNIGYESSSGFRDAFSKIMGAPPTNFNKHHNVLKASWLDTPLGPVLTIADDKSLFLLEFMERRGLERELERLRFRTKSTIIPGTTDPIISIEKELKSYFEGTLKDFKTPLHLIGTSFQRCVWNALMQIPYGETRSYAELSAAIGKPMAHRAVANANGANQFAIVIPCHRVIRNNGDICGYGGGVARKKWLIHHEKSML